MDIKKLSEAATADNDDDGRHPIHKACQEDDLLHLSKELARDSRVKDLAGEANGWTPLMYCAVYGSFDCLKTLVMAGADVNKAGKRGELPVHAASMNNHERCLRYLLEHGGDVNKPKDANKGVTMAHHAAHKGDEATLKLLLKHGADVNKTDTNGNTPLHTAVRSDHEVCAKMLIKAGSDVNRADQNANAPLHTAVKNGNESCAKMLIKAGCNINHQNKEGETAAHIAAREGKDDILSALVAAGADLSIASVANLTPFQEGAAQQKKGNDKCIRILLKTAQGVNLPSDISRGLCLAHEAARDGNEEQLRLLLKSGADVNILDKAGRTPAHFAAKEGKAKCLRYLTEHGANLTIKATNGETVVHKAARSDSDACLVYLLEQCKQSPNEQTGDGRTAVHIALHNLNRVCLQYLVEKAKADFNKPDNAGRTPVHEAVQYGKEDTLKYLLQNGAGLKQDNRGLNPAHLAAETSHPNCLQIICSHDLGACLSEVDANGQTPMFHAAKSGSEECLKILVEHGCNPNGRDVDGHTPLMYAKEKGQGACVLYLEGIMCDQLEAGIAQDDSDALNAFLDDPDFDWPLSHPPLHTCALMGSVKCVNALLARGVPVDTREKGSGGRNRTALHYASYAGNIGVVHVLCEAGASVGIKDAKGRRAVDVAKRKNRPDCESYLIMKSSSIKIWDASEVGVFLCYICQLSNETSTRFMEDGVTGPTLLQFVSENDGSIMLGEPYRLTNDERATVVKTVKEMTDGLATAVKKWLAKKLRGSDSDHQPCTGGCFPLIRS